MPAASKTKRKTTERKTATTKTADFDKTFAALKRLVTAHRAHTRVEIDQPGYYCTVSKLATCRGKPLWFAGVRKGKAYVSFHLTPMYMCPELAKGLSPELKKRRQGQGCFNFTSPDAKLFRELAAVTKAGMEAYRKKKDF